MKRASKAKAAAGAGARHVRSAASILANGINGWAMEEAQREMAEEARQKREASPVCDCAPNDECRCAKRAAPTRQADGITAADLLALRAAMPSGAALVGIWPADLFALEAAGWSEDEAERARSTGAAWFAEVNHPRATCEESTLYALTLSGWKEVR